MSNTNDLLNELNQNIIKYDELLDYWFSNTPASIVAAGGDDVFAQADHLRNRSKEIIQILRGDINEN